MNEFTKLEPLTLRNTEPNEEEFERICEKMLQGYTLKNAAKLAGVTPLRINLCLMNNAERASQIERIRSYMAGNMFDSARDLYDTDSDVQDEQGKPSNALVSHKNNHAQLLMKQAAVYNKKYGSVQKTEFSNSSDFADEMIRALERSSPTGLSDE